MRKLSASPAQINKPMLSMLGFVLLAGASGCIGPKAIRTAEVEVYQKASGISKSYELLDKVDLNTVSGNLDYAKGLAALYLRSANASAVLKGVLDVGVLGAAIGVGAASLYSFDVTHLRKVGLAVGGGGLLGQYFRSDGYEQHLTDAALKLVCIMTRSREAVILIDNDKNAVATVVDGILAIQGKLTVKLNNLPISYGQASLDAAAFIKGGETLSGRVGPLDKADHAGRAKVINDLQIQVAKCVLGSPIF